MPTLTSYFGFLLAVLTITAGIFISLNKIRLIWFAILRWIGNFRIFRIFSLSYDQFLVIEIHGQYKFIFKDRYYPHLFTFNQTQMIEVFLFGIVLGLIPITLAGLFVTAYLQYRRGDQLDIWFITVSFVYWPPIFCFNPNWQEIKLTLWIRLLSHYLVSIWEEWYRAL